jgi:iron complex outermembrane receptor protein
MGGDSAGEKCLARRLGLLLSAALLLACPARAEQITDAYDIDQLSIEQLAEVEITSVSKQQQPLSGAPAAVYVISHNDVINSGAMNIGDILRLAPNLEVTQTSPSAYVVTARGLNGNAADQNFSDKLLVLVDGRSVYSPLYSGVYWDMQDVPPEDIERIEVISGPGGTLYGANAVNGVVNIITRKAADTEGGVIDLSAGTLESSAMLQYGGALGDDLHYRIYGKDFYQRSFDSAPDVSARDGWAKPQGGFRLDWTPADDSVTLEGDLYGGAESQLAAANNIIGGGNLTGQWQHKLSDDSSLQVLAYYDETQRESLNGGGFHLNTYDLEAQNNFKLGSWNNIVWGAGDRIDHYFITNRIAPASSLLFVPQSRTLNLADIFAEDHIPISDTVQLVAGLKLENDPYSGVTPMPSVRLSWQPDSDNLVWGAVSRVIRSPTPFDTDVQEKLGSAVFLTGNPAFLPEQLTAYELGYRAQLAPDLSVSVSGYQNVYENLKSIEKGIYPGVPLAWGNGIEGSIHGVEIWGDFRATDWWRLAASVVVQHDDLKYSPLSSGLLGLMQEGDDPHHQASLRSTINILPDLTWEADFRYVGKLPNPVVPEYVELNSRLAWKVNDQWELAISGFNLLHAQHVEYAPGDEIPRSVYIETRFRF